MQQYYAQNTKQNGSRFSVILYTLESLQVHWLSTWLEVTHATVKCYHRYLRHQLSLILIYTVRLYVR